MILVLAVSAFACRADDSQASLRWKLPDRLKSILLDKTGAKSIRTISKMAYRHTEKFDVLAVSAELENRGDIKSGIREGIMHVEVVFVETKEGKIVLYSLEFPMGQLLSNQDIDLNKGFVEYK
jgi:hypothetical protein